MRDRLIELIKDLAEDMVAKCDDDCYTCKHGDCVGKIADRLLAEGVIVPPCKVGSDVYMPWRWQGVEGIAILTVEYIIHSEVGMCVGTDLTSDDEEYLYAYDNGEFYFSDFGRIIFLTREEAEKALAERREGDGT